ncbi:uncharacterized protein [Antedon mediterranea]|uniref:uncharacterized protein isoform X2 n=1 Tax=Antedon mediterranea TaxID=105859 RepID=UPI003AF6CB7E
MQNHRNQLLTSPVPEDLSKPRVLMINTGQRRLSADSCGTPVHTPVNTVAPPNALSQNCTPVHTPVNTVPPHNPLSSNHGTPVHTPVNTVPPPNPLSNTVNVAMSAAVAYQLQQHQQQQQQQQQQQHHQHQHQQQHHQQQHSYLTDNMNMNLNQTLEQQVLAQLIERNAVVPTMNNQTKIPSATPPTPTSPRDLSMRAMTSTQHAENDVAQQQQQYSPDYQHQPVIRQNHNVIQGQRGYQTNIYQSSVWPQFNTQPVTRFAFRTGQDSMTGFNPAAFAQLQPNVVNPMNNFLKQEDGFVNQGMDAYGVAREISHLNMQHVPNFMRQPVYIPNTKMPLVKGSNENNNDKSSPNIQSIVDTAQGPVNMTTKTISPLSVNVSLSLADVSQDSPSLTRQSPALRYRPPGDQMLSAINCNEELLQDGGLMPEAQVPVSLEDSLLQSGMVITTTGGRLNDNTNLTLDSNPASVNSSAFDIFENSGDVEDQNYIADALSPQSLSMETEPTSTISSMTSTSSDVRHSAMNDLPSSLIGQSGGQSDTVSAPKAKKGRPRIGQGHRYSQACPVCSKIFGSSSALAKHKLIHSSERRHKCIICAKSFKRQDHLTGHLLTHRTKKPYECIVNNCGKSYCDIRSLRRHFESQHHGLVMEDNMHFSGDEKDEVLAQAEAAAVAQATQQESQKNSITSSEVISDFLNTMDTLNSDQIVQTGNGDSSSARLQFLAQTAAHQHGQGGNQGSQFTGQDVSPNQPLSPPQQNQSMTAPSFLQQTMTSGVNTLTGISLPSMVLPPRSNFGQMTRFELPGDRAKIPTFPNRMIDKVLDKRQPVECSICKRKFKSMPALNGHMRLHGGYNNTRRIGLTTASATIVPRASQVETGATGTMPVSTMSEYRAIQSDASTVTVPSLNQSANIGNYFQAPPGISRTLDTNSSYPYPGGKPNSWAVSMSGRCASQFSMPRLPPPTLPRIGVGLVSQNLNTSNFSTGQLNMQDPSHLPISYNQTSIASSIPVPNLPLSLESLMQNTRLPPMQPMSTIMSVTHNNILPETSVKQENILNVNEDVLRATVKRKHEDLGPPVLKAISPVLPHVTTTKAEPEEPEKKKDDIIFQKPTEVKNPKKKPRPSPLIIPPCVNTTSGVLLPGTFASQMRSPRDLGTMFYGSKSSTPPPYTPPPMLSPIRSGSGLYFNNVTVPLPVPATTPKTPSMIQLHRRSTGSSSEEATEFLYSEPHINVGTDYQAVMPPCRSKSYMDYGPDPREGTLMWSPQYEHLYAENEFNSFVEFATSGAIPGAARNLEYAYHCLARAKGDMELALLMLMSQDAKVPRGMADNCQDYRYDFPERWNLQERKAFRDGYKSKGKDFFEIGKCVPTKTVKDLVEYYYRWKKLYPYNAEMQKFCHHSNVNPTDETRLMECDSKADTNGLFNCTYAGCTASFKSKQALNGHIRVHGGSNNRTSTRASRRSPSPMSTTSSDSSEETLRPAPQPVVVQPPVQEEFPCKICGKVFYKVKSRSAHMKSHSTKVKQNAQQNKQNKQVIVAAPPPVYIAPPPPPPVITSISEEECESQSEDDDNDRNDNDRDDDDRDDDDDASGSDEDDNEIGDEDNDEVDDDDEEEDDEEDGDEMEDGGSVSETESMSETASDEDYNM